MNRRLEKQRLRNKKRKSEKRQKCANRRKCKLERRARRCKCKLERRARRCRNRVINSTHDCEISIVSDDFYWQDFFTATSRSIPFNFNLWANFVREAMYQEERRKNNGRL